MVVHVIPEMDQVFNLGSEMMGIGRGRGTEEGRIDVFNRDRAPSKMTDETHSPGTVDLNLRNLINQSPASVGNFRPPRMSVDML
jgi:hypothetical protein